MSLTPTKVIDHLYVLATFSPSPSLWAWLTARTILDNEQQTKPQRYIPLALKI